MGTMVKRTVSLLAVFTFVLAGLAPVFAEDAYRIVIMPKIVGIDYYNAVEEGVLDAAKELEGKAEIIWMGPTQDQVERQIEMIDNLIATHPDAICVAANDRAAIVPVMKRASREGIKVLSWDGDSDFRDFFVNLVRLR